MTRRTDSRQVTVLAIADCPNVVVLLERLAEAAAFTGTRVDVSIRLIATEAEAKQARFRGSPTLWLDGRDPFATDGPVAIGCRIYRSDVGLDGAPSVTQLVGVLSEPTTDGHADVR